MNYDRIYSEFIADRLTKQPVKPEYFEKHHILPRSLGGMNGKENIIRLAPEDHLFAHLLLAQIHGGKMWTAVYAMVYLANDTTSYRRQFGNRPMFGIMRRKIAAHHSALFSGATGPQADKAIRTLCHFDGRVATGNRFELESITGVTRQQISAVFRGAKKNAHGWYCKEHNPQGLTGPELISLGLRSVQRVTLYHHDGREWAGTKWDFTIEFGAKLWFQSAHGDCRGWHRSKADASEYPARMRDRNALNSSLRGSVAGLSNANADKTLHKFLVIKTGEIVEATKWDVKQMFGVTKSGLCSLFNGRQTKTGGIALATEAS